MLDLKGIRAAHQVLDYTYGGSNGYKKLSGHFQDDTLRILYKAVFQYADQDSMYNQIKVMSQESEEIIKAKVTEMKTAYKENSENNDSLSLKDAGDTDNVELISAHPYSPRKVAYYSREIIYQIT